MQERCISDWVLVLEDLIMIEKFLGERLQGKVEVGADVSKKLTKSEYGNFLNASGITRGSLQKEHQARFTDLIYRNQGVFSLHDEAMGYCDQLTHTIPTSIDKAVHLLPQDNPRTVAR